MNVKIKVTKSNTAQVKPIRFTLSLTPELSAALDRVRKQAGISRHALVIAILEKAVEDPNFVIEVEK